MLTDKAIRYGVATYRHFLLYLGNLLSVSIKTNNMEHDMVQSFYFYYEYKSKCVCVCVCELVCWCVVTFLCECVCGPACERAYVCGMHVISVGAGHMCGCVIHVM